MADFFQIHTTQKKKEKFKRHIKKQGHMAKSKGQTKSLELSCQKERTMNHLEKIQSKCLKEAQCSTKIADRQINKMKNDTQTKF